MIEQLLQLSHSFLLSHGSLAVFLIGFIEEVFFILPSSIIFLGAGFLLIDPSAPVYEVFFHIFFTLGFWGALGMTLGAYVMYGLFYWGGHPLVDRLGKYVGISWNAITLLQEKLNKTNLDDWAFLMLRVIPIWSIALVSAFSGLVRYPLLKFTLYTFIGTFIRVAFLGFIGWQMGEAYRKVSDVLQEFELIGALIMIVSIVAVYVYFQRYEKTRDSSRDLE